MTPPSTRSTSLTTSFFREPLVALTAATWRRTFCCCSMASVRRLRSRSFSSGMPCGVASDDSVHEAWLSIRFCASTYKLKSHVNPGEPITKKHNHAIHHLRLHIGKLTSALIRSRGDVGADSSVCPTFGSGSTGSLPTISFLVGPVLSHCTMLSSMRGTLSDAPEGSPLVWWDRASGDGGC